MDPKGANLASTDLLEISQLVSGSYVTKSITGAEIIASVPASVTAWGTITGTLSSQTDLNTALSGKQPTVTLTTTGTSGASTFVANTLNVPTYSLSGLGGVPTTRTLTINGTTQDLSADRTFTISTGITIGTTAITSGTVGRVLFEGTGNVVQESANLFWDNTNGRLGIGTSTPNYTFELKNTTGGATTPTLSFVTSTYNSQIIVGNSTYPFALGANSLNIYHGVAGGIGFYNGGASPTLRFSILSDGKTIVGSATTATRIFEVNDIVNGGGIGLNSTAVNTSYAIVHTATGANSWSFNSAGTGSSQRAGTLSIGATTNNILFFSNGNTILGGSNSADAGFKLDVNGTVRSQGNLFFGVAGSYLLGDANNIRLIDKNNVIILQSFPNGVASSETYLRTSSGNGAFLRLRDDYINLEWANSTLSSTVQNPINITRGYFGNVGATDKSVLYIKSNSFSNLSNATTLRGIFIDINDTTTYTGFTNTRAIEAPRGGAYFNTTSVNASAILQADSTSQGFLPPRMTTTQKNAIASPATGLQIYDSTLNRPCFYNGTTWITL